MSRTPAEFIHSCPSPVSRRSGISRWEVAHHIASTSWFSLAPVLKWGWRVPHGHPTSSCIGTNFQKSYLDIIVQNVFWSLDTQFPTPSLVIEKPGATSALAWMQGMQTADAPFSPETLSSILSLSTHNYVLASLTWLRCRYLEATEDHASCLLSFHVPAQQVPCTWPEGCGSICLGFQLQGPTHLPKQLDVHLSVSWPKIPKHSPRRCFLGVGANQGKSRALPLGDVTTVRHLVPEHASFE